MTAGTDVFTRRRDDEAQRTLILEIQTKASRLTFMRNLLPSLTLICAACTSLAAQERSRASVSADSGGNEEVWAHLTERIGTYSWSAGDSDLRAFDLKAEPVLRYTDPVREFLGGGQLHLVLDGERPVAACTIWLNLDKKATVREFSTLSGEVLVCRNAAGDVVWQPRPAEVLHVPLPRAGEPAATAQRRLAQMRASARRFSVTYFRRRDGEPFELRLLPQPIYRFVDADHGITDAALFAFVHSTDPDELLMIAARTDPDSGEAVWSYSLARMNSGPMQVRLDDAEIHTYQDYRRNPRSPDDQYAEEDDLPYPAP